MYKGTHQPREGVTYINKIQAALFIKLVEALKIRTNVSRSLMAKYKIGELVKEDRLATKAAFTPQWTNDTPQEQGKCVIA